MLKIDPTTNSTPNRGKMTFTTGNGSTFGGGKKVTSHNIKQEYDNAECRVDPFTSTLLQRSGAVDIVSVIRTLPGRGSGH